MLMDNQDLVLCLPTGGGKSLVYQLPSMVKRGVGVIVSPLIALIQDQVQFLNNLGINAVALSSSVKMSDMRVILDNMRKEVVPYKFIYLTPERIAKSAECMELLKIMYKNNNLSLFGIDEAHCISEWGHDFRKDYRKLGILKDTFPDIPVVAVTGSCTPEVKDDVKKQLHIPDSYYMSTSYNRPNIRISVSRSKDKSEDILNFILNNNMTNSSGIIYCLTIKEAEQVTEYLIEKKLLAASYHSKISIKNRSFVQKLWMEGDEVKIVCTTVAFGLGINKPDVRFVIHSSMPSTMEGYFQQIGRAGRDGKPSIAAMFYARRDRYISEAMIKSTISNSYSVQTIDHGRTDVLLTKLDDILNFCENTLKCRRQSLLNYFGEDFSVHNCNNTCDNCLRKLPQYQKLEKKLKAAENKTGLKQKKTTKKYKINIETATKLVDSTENSFKELPDKFLNRKKLSDIDPKIIEKLERCSTRDGISILSKTAIKAIARAQPQSFEELCSISGVGKQKGHILSRQILELFNDN